VGFLLVPTKNQPFSKMKGVRLLPI
jgi:hypothetical protein